MLEKMLYMCEIKNIESGTVSKYDKKNKWLLINYNDGDAENSTLTELKKILIYTKDKPKNKPTKEIREKVV